MWRTCGISSASSERAWRAPGRVNIVGEHIDYLGASVLPFACDLELVCRVRGAPRVELVSGAEEVSISLDDPEPPGGWGAYVWGVIRALREAGHRVRGIEGSVTSTIPVGAGLSSSAALEAAVALALTGGVRPEPSVLQRAEHHATGVPCGLMDQSAVLLARAGSAMLLDCSTGDVEHVPIGEGIGFVVVDTGTRRELRDGRYAQRRAEVLDELSGRSLAELTTRPATPRLRHAYDEAERVVAAVDAFRSDDLAGLGAIVDASHASLRDDFEVSSAALDLAASTARAHGGCTGARLVGAGFAGCVLAVVEADAADLMAAWVSERLRERLPKASARAVRSVDGAGET